MAAIVGYNEALKLRNSFAPNVKVNQIVVDPNKVIAEIQSLVLEINKNKNSDSPDKLNQQPLRKGQKGKEPNNIGQSR